MKITKIFKREDKTEIELTISLTIDHRTTHKNISVFKKQFRKGKWENAIDTDSHQYRRLSMEDRQKYELEQIETIVSKDEIDLVKSELIELIKAKF